MLDITERLYLTRKLLGLSQATAAKDLGFSRRTVYLWETGKQPHPVHAEVIKRATRQWLTHAMVVEENNEDGLPFEREPV